MRVSSSSHSRLCNGSSDPHRFASTRSTEKLPTAIRMSSMLICLGGRPNRYPPPGPAVPTKSPALRKDAMICSA